MTKGTKIVLLVVGGVVLVGVVGIAAVLVIGYKYVQKSTSTDPKEIDSIARKIVDYELPENYKPAYSTDIMGFQMVMFQKQNSNGGQMIVLWQISNPSVANNPEARKQFEKSMEEGIKQRGFNKEGAVKVGEKRITIRGKQTSLVKYVNSSEDTKKSAVQAVATFEGKGGPATVQIFAQEGSFNDGEVDSFLSSLK
jgi:hypothetical protein